jgi:hypothetical protein
MANELLAFIDALLVFADCWLILAIAILWGANGK